MYFSLICTKLAEISVRQWLYFSSLLALSTSSNSPHFLRLPERLLGRDVIPLYNIGNFSQRWIGCINKDSTSHWSVRNVPFFSVHAGIIYHRASEHTQFDLLNILLGVGNLDTIDYFFRSLTLTWKNKMCTNHEKWSRLIPTLIRLKPSKLLKTV